MVGLFANTSAGLCANTSAGLYANKIERFVCKVECTHKRQGCVHTQVGCAVLFGNISQSIVNVSAKKFECEFLIKFVWMCLLNNFNVVLRKSNVSANTLKCSLKMSYLWKFPLRSDPPEILFIYCHTRSYPDSKPSWNSFKFYLAR